MRNALLFAMLAVWATPLACFGQECEARDPTTAEVNSREGVRLAKKGNFEEAIALFRMATSLDACEPKYRLRLARALSRSEKYDEAEQTYAEIVGGFPGTPEAEKAKEELAEVRTKKVAAASVTPPAPATPTSPATPSTPLVPEETGLYASTEVSGGFPWRIVGFSAAGLGLVSVGAGVYFALDSQSADDDLKAQKYHGDVGRYDELVDQRSSSRTMAYVFYGVGGALIVGGVLAALLLPEEDQPAPGSTLGFYPADGGGQVFYSVGF